VLPTLGTAGLGLDVKHVEGDSWTTDGRLRTFASELGLLSCPDTTLGTADLCPGDCSCCDIVGG